MDKEISICMIRLFQEKSKAMAQNYPYKLQNKIAFLKKKTQAYILKEYTMYLFEKMDPESHTKTYSHETTGF